MRNLFLIAGLALTLAGANAQDLTLIGLAEGKEPAKKTAAPALTSLGQLTLEGCLVRGNEADPYLLTEKGTGKTVTVVGTSDLEQQLGRLVKLRGAMSAGERYFHATQVEMMANSCLNDAVPVPSDKGLTADEQGNSEVDRRMTQAIRYAVVNDDSLSFAAHNVKINTLNGVVTLRGQVRSQEEKQALELKAVRVASAPNVKNELTVDAKNPPEPPTK
jgi:osmotically-inducible protein OsmY